MRLTVRRQRVLASDRSLQQGQPDDGRGLRAQDARSEGDRANEGLPVAISVRSRGPRPPSGPISSARGSFRWRRCGAIGLAPCAANSGRVIRPVGQDLVQRPERVDGWHGQPFTLLCGVDRNGVQPVEVDPAGVGPFCHHWQQRGYAQVPWPSAPQGLCVSRFSGANTSHRSGSGACGRTSRSTNQGGLAAADTADPGPPFAVHAVEQEDEESPAARRITLAEIMRLSWRCLDHRRRSVSGAVT